MEVALPEYPLMRILVVSDAWYPQVNGVVRTVATVATELEALGHTVLVVGPDRFRTIPCPTYPDIRLALFPRRRLDRIVADFRPDALHIATEGPLGFSARAFAIRHGWQFTTSFHTKFAEYLKARTGIPLGITYAMLRRFHNAGAGTMAATASLCRELVARGFTQVRAWSRGVDLAQFNPEPRAEYDFPRPIFAYVGRVAVEKNIGAFLDLDLPGSKIVVGDGPQLAELKKHYPAVHFLGAKFGADLAAAYAGADVKVFPSRTDTFGLVLLESLACGTPVAAFPVTGPLDVLTEEVGSLNEDLRAACLAALTRDRPTCRAYAERFSWRACTELFIEHLVVTHPEASKAV